MDYNELYLEIEKIKNDEFNVDFINKASNILSKAGNIYINNLKVNISNNSTNYRQIVFMVDELLKDKLRNLNAGLSNGNINNIVSGIEKNSLIINDIIKFEDYIFLEGNLKYNFSDINYLLLEDNNLKKITSSQFSNIFDSSNYLNTQFGKNVIDMITIELNKYLKEYFDLKEDILINNYSNILIPYACTDIYLNMDLNSICKKIINNEVCNIEMVYIFNNQEIHLFNINIVHDNFSINEVNPSIWKLSDNSKKMVK